MPEAFQRPRYFDGELLGQDDFTLEQVYQTSRRRLHNRLLHTWGIMEGLALSFVTGATRATVSPGSAIDSAGNEIVLTTATTTPDASTQPGKTLFVTLAYAEAQTDARTGNGVTGNSRVTETPVIQIQEAAPAAPSMQLVLGRIVVGGDGKIASTDTGGNGVFRVLAGAQGSLVVDPLHINDSGLRSALVFGGVGSGEGIASKRTPTGNQYGLDFYTAGGTLRMSITNGGNVGIGTSTPGARLDVSASGASQCCASVMPTIALSENSQASGRRSWLQFHNQGEAEGYLRLAGGGPAGSGREGARRLEIGDSQGVNTGLSMSGALSVGGDVAIAGKHAFRGSDPWLRLNQDGAFSSGVHTPGLLGPGSLNVGGLGGWGNPGGGNAWIAGNLGLGTTTPRARLDVNGGAMINGLAIGTPGAGVPGYAYVYETVGMNNVNMNLRLASGQSILFHPGNSTDVKVAIDGAGRIGVAGQPAAPRTSGWFGGIHTWDFEAEGSAWCRNGWGSGARDLAENFDTSDRVVAGDVVCFDRQRDTVVLSRTANDPMVCGVVSTRPGVLLGSDPERLPVDDNAPVALCGRVPCKVTDENGPIGRGDLLTTSSTPGHAMKARPRCVDGQLVYDAGTIIGKALTTLANGCGIVEIFVTAR